MRRPETQSSYWLIGDGKSLSLVGKNDLVVVEAEGFHRWK